MPVGRIVLKSISESRKLADLKTDGARLLYTWLIPHLNINGCFHGDPIVVKGKIFTRLRKSIKEIDGYLADLEKTGLIVRYSTNGDTFIFVPDFKEKQPSLREDREGKSRIPKPTPDQLRTNSGPTPAEVKISKDKLSKDNILCDPKPGNPFELLWTSYPSKVGKKQAERHFNGSVRTPEDFSAIQKALDNYLKSDRVARGYVQNGSTWFNNWRDWVDFKEPRKKNIVDQANATLEKMEKAGL